MASSAPGTLVIVNATFRPNDDCYKQHCMGRIPGAVFVDLGVVRDMTAPYPHMMPTAGHFTKMMGHLGIKKSQTVVIYEHGQGWFATRAAMVLRSYGHPRVHVLDGGFNKWKAAGNEVQQDEGGEDAYDADFDYNLDAD